MTTSLPEHYRHRLFAIRYQNHRSAIYRRDSGDWLSVYAHGACPIPGTSQLLMYNDEILDHIKRVQSGQLGGAAASFGHRSDKERKFFQERIRERAYCRRNTQLSSSRRGSGYRLFMGMIFPSPVIVHQGRGFFHE